MFVGDAGLAKSDSETANGVEEGDVCRVLGRVNGEGCLHGHVAKGASARCPHRAQRKIADDDHEAARRSRKVGTPRKLDLCLDLPLRPDKRPRGVAQIRCCARRCFEPAALLAYLLRACDMPKKDTGKNANGVYTTMRSN